MFFKKNNVDGALLLYRYIGRQLKISKNTISSWNKVLLRSFFLLILQILYTHSTDFIVFISVFSYILYYNLQYCQLVIASLLVDIILLVVLFRSDSRDRKRSRSRSRDRERDRDRRRRSRSRDKKRRQRLVL